jgi:hypothetical protein
MVTVRDGAGSRHRLQVTAETLYEAAALALKTLKASSWVQEVGPTKRIEVEVNEPVTKHTVTVTQLQRWAEASAITPLTESARTRSRQCWRKQLPKVE